MFKESKFNIYKELDGIKYIYNSTSKAFVKTHEDGRLNIEQLSNDELAILVQNGFVVEENYDEEYAIEYLYKKYYYATSSLNIILTPTLACNFKCPYCFEKGININQNKDFYKILKKYTEENFKFYNNIQISLFGGEPLLEEKSLFNYFEFLEKDKQKNKYKYTTSIVTNGSLICEDNIIKLIEHNLSSIQITIDGTRINHDKQRIFHNNDKTYDLLIKNIKIIINIFKIKKREDIKLVLRLNLKDVTLDEIKETLTEFDKDERKYIELLFRPIYNTEKYKEYNTTKLVDLKQYFDLGKTLGYRIVQNNYFYKTCEACGDDNFFYLMPDMSMWKCINDLKHEYAKIGYISKKGEINIDAQNLIRWSKMANCFEDSKCKKCNLLPDCYGGCILVKSKTGIRQCKVFEMSSLPYLY